MPDKPVTGAAELKPHQLYPAGRKLAPDFLVVTRRPLLNRTTPITSIGSCFSREIRNELVRKGFNYLQTEPGAAGKNPEGWNRVYNTFCLRQEFERALSDFAPRERFWEFDGQILDPYRKRVAWTSREQAEAELAQHRESARQAFTQAEIVIITVGLREIWFSKLDGAVFSQLPPSKVLDPARHAFRCSTVEENLANLEAIHALLKQANPRCRIIVTVSPVPLRATFLDQNVLISNSISKATLVVATHEFVARHDDVHYFPGYELVTVGIKKPLERDNRHVRRRAVARIMRVFEQMFVAG
jgi:hypothetical protein